MNRVKRSEYLKAIETINAYHNQLGVEFKTASKIVNQISFGSINKDTVLDDLEISVRLYNCIVAALSGKKIGINKSELSLQEISKIIPHEIFKLARNVNSCVYEEYVRLLIFCDLLKRPQQATK